MTSIYQDIDAGIAYQCKDLEDRGVPLDLSELNLKIFKKNQEINLLKEDLNKRFGFIPKFSDEDTWKRIYYSSTGRNIAYMSNGRFKVSMSRKTVEELKNTCPALVDIYQGLRLEKLISQMTKVGGIKVQSLGEFSLKPRYKIDVNSGQVFIRDPNLRTWGRDLKDVVRRSGFTFLLLWYDALDLMVLQDFSQDPVLESDLETPDPYYTMGCRFWETGSPTQEQVFIARVAFTLFCNGVNPDKFWASINTTYSDRCAITERDAGILYEKFTKHYTVCCEYFNQVSRMPVAPRSAFDRWGIGRDSRCYAMSSTAADITKLGFLSVLEDSRFKKLEVDPLALVSGKMLLSVPEGLDLDQVRDYLLGDFRGAYTKYKLKPCISTGYSWGECDGFGDLSHDEDF